ncbi:transmembrane protein 176A isoform X2 [Meles meles]|uniref:transmembrane protein 176A isoform X2 n=1 Tax=Meles meles TaxID=9662 RepID=UPI001E69F09C|nr:transmembrane protein 176A isoform X2 [Meles meles]
MDSRKVAGAEARQMSASMETVDSGEVAPGAPEPTRIDVHIHQESALATLLVRACSQLWSPTPDTTSRTGGRSRLLVASWVVQIVLGLLSGTLGGFLYFFHFCTLRGSGAALWTGAVAVLAGAVAFIYEKRGGIYWALLKTLLALAAFSTAIAAVVIGASYFYEYKFHFREYICQVSSTGLSWAAAPQTTPSPGESRRLRLCLSYLSMLKALFISFQAMLLGVWVLLFLASLVPLCLYCWRRSQRKKETDQRKLLEVREAQLRFS